MYCKRQAALFVYMFGTWRHMRWQMKMPVDFVLPKLIQCALRMCISPYLICVDWLGMYRDIRCLLSWSPPWRAHHAVPTNWLRISANEAHIQVCRGLLPPWTMYFPCSCHSSYNIDFKCVKVCMRYTAFRNGAVLDLNHAAMQQPPQLQGKYIVHGGNKPWQT
jgi:hypothetical protein